MRLSPLDTIWLMLESRDTPMHVGTLAIFTRPKGAGPAYLSDLAQSMRECSELASPWDQRLVGSGSSSLAPRLVADADFDLDYHFRHSALPRPGGERELGVVVSRLHSQALDRHRPLWELHLIEGLERDRFALYFKAHHALIDNVNGVPFVLSTLASRASARGVRPPWSQPCSSVDGSQQPDVGDVLRAVAETPQTLSSLGQAATGMLRSVLQREEGSFMLPRGAPRSTLNRRINAQRRFATQQFDQRRIQRLADRAGTTLNTVLAYLCGSALRRFFKEYNALPDEPLVAALPVSLQERSEILPGNAITGLRVALATHIGDPIERLEALRASIARVHADRASLPAAAATSYIALRTAPFYATQLPGVGRFVPPMFNLTVSNMPGVASARYYNGARLEAIYPLSPLLQFSALSIDCVSYAGTLNVGFTGARDTLPHLQRLAVYAGQAVVDLERALRGAGRRA